MKVTCVNCKLRFDADDDARISQCPRCSSKKLRFERAEVERKPFDQSRPRVYSSQGQVVHGDTKAAWQSFHSADVKACPKCGGTEFDMNFKRKEKTCKKCGEILNMPRRFS